MTLPSRKRNSRSAAGQSGYSGRVQVKLLYFGVLKDLLGSAGEAVELPDGAKVMTLLRVLRQRTSNNRTSDTTANGMEERVWQNLAVAVNREYAGAGVLLHEGDEVALLPPVSGGWCCAHSEVLAMLAED